MSDKKMALPYTCQQILDMFEALYNGYVIPKEVKEDGSLGEDLGKIIMSKKEVEELLVELQKEIAEFQDDIDGLVGIIDEEVKPELEAEIAGAVEVEAERAKEAEKDLTDRIQVLEDIDHDIFVVKEVGKSLVEDDKIALIHKDHNHDDLAVKADIEAAIDLKADQADMDLLDVKIKEFEARIAALESKQIAIADIEGLQAELDKKADK
jgi:chaperonin cofactor prefoldin